ncbi:MAG: hypothetical protein SV775_13120 [Thermodesulfobacteriota bacterium]|nr:hypothetical protein [Thermodesulfobacteriota bacterium]
MTFPKRTLICGVFAAILYVLLSYHFIFFGWTSVKRLKKSRLTLEYTFYSAVGKSNAAIMSQDDLRRDGIAYMLIDMGRMTEEQKDKFMDKYEIEEYEIEEGEEDEKAVEH